MENLNEMESLSKEQAIIISAYTGYLCCEFSDMHQAVEKKLGYPVWTHQFASEEFSEEIRKVFKEDFLSLVPE